MLWFTVWTLLVLGSLVGAFFLLRHLYRAAKGLLHEVERASQTMAAVADRAAELEDAARRLHPVAPVDLADPEPARQRRAVAAVATARRRAERTARHELVYRRWRSFSH